MKSVTVIKYAIQDKFKLAAARPQYQLEKYNRAVPWSEEFVTEIKSGLSACQVM